MNLEKRFNHFGRFILVHTDDTFQNTSFTILNPAISNYQKICLSLRTVKCVLMSEWVTRTIPNFFIDNILNFRTAMIFQVFSLFHIKLPKSLHFLFLFKNIHLLLQWERCSEVYCNQNVQCSTQVSCTPNCLLCRFVFFWRAKWVLLNFTISKNSQLLNNVFLFQLNV